VGYDALNASNAEGKAALTEFLGDDLGGDVGIEMAVADDLADDFGGAAVVGLGSALGAEEGAGAALGEGVEDLIIAPPGKAVLAGGGGCAEPLALALVDHGEFANDFVVGLDGETARGSFETETAGIDA